MLRETKFSEKQNYAKNEREVRDEARGLTMNVKN